MIKAYTELLVTHHNGTLDLDVIDEVILSISPERDWLSSVDGRRAVFLKVTQLVEEKLGVETSGEVIYDLRNTAMNNTGLTGAKTPKESRGGGVTTVPAPGGHERFLDTEIVAIYW